MDANRFMKMTSVDLADALTYGRYTASERPALFDALGVAFSENEIALLLRAKLEDGRERLDDLRQRMDAR